MAAYAINKKLNCTIITDASMGCETCIGTGTCAIEFIDKHTNGRVQIGPATLYTILGKFEKEKYIKEISVEGRKRTYVITEKGKDAYNTELVRLRQCILDSDNVQSFNQYWRDRHEKTT